MLLDQDGALERAPGQLAFGIPVGILWCRAFLGFDADEHLGEEEALQLLPGSAVFAHADGTVEA